jgi:hypothetical protein
MWFYCGLQIQVHPSIIVVSIFLSGPIDHRVCRFWDDSTGVRNSRFFRSNLRIRAKYSTDRELKRDMDELMELSLRKAEATICSGSRKPQLYSQTEGAGFGLGNAPDGTSSRPP